MSNTIKALCLAGPTGAGKTEAAIRLCIALNGEVINTDSRQVYSDFPIITAQPSCAERSICQHHLYGFLNTEHKLSAGQWADRALDAARDIVARGKIPIFVGGTGLYFKAILEGIATIPTIAEHVSSELTKRCQEEGAVALHAELMQVDAPYATRIHPNDSQRVVRALEVFISTGKTFTWWHENAMPKPPVQAYYMGVDMNLESLSPRLGARIEAMLEVGAVAEAKAAFKRCDKRDAPAWSGIGCAELYAYICEELSFEQALELWRKNTRAYAKRQLTWFRAIKYINWFEPTNIQGMLDNSRKFLNF